MDKKNLKNIESHLISLMKDGAGISAETVQNFQSDFRDLNLMHLENLGDLLHIGVFICDTDGKIIYVNSMNEKLVGVKREECIGEFFKDVLQRHNITNVAIDYVREKKQSYSSLVFVPATGVQILSTGAPIFDIHDTLIGVIVIDQDVSEIMSLTQQLKNSESKTVYYREMNDQTGRVIEQLNRQGINLKKHFTDMEQFVSPAIQKAYELAYQAAQTDVTTLLTGETGTGKEVLANYIFENSARNRGAFVKVNCASIPANLLESELFGYVKGAFTGASDKGKMGLFEVANHGTIFLDEIGELPMDFQAKLLRAIQQKEINRIGSTKIIKLDIRIIAATNRNLKEMAEAGKFRRDLYYRLNVFPIPI
ncbi:MAG: sigma 54-interacting transcriptional regulator, partial [Clostridiales bacterium]|nr:sigma 54-interacting transcriptional regulator [Clostridiales bacterium]